MSLQNPSRGSFSAIPSTRSSLIEQPELHDHVKEEDDVTVVGESACGSQWKIKLDRFLPENLMDILRAGGLVKAAWKLNGLGLTGKEKNMGETVIEKIIHHNTANRCAAISSYCLR